MAFLYYELVIREASKCVTHEGTYGSGTWVQWGENSHTGGEPSGNSSFSVTEKNAVLYLVYKSWLQTFNSTGEKNV